MNEKPKVEEIPLIDSHLVDEVKRHWDYKVKPKNSLGFLEDIVAQILSIRPTMNISNIKPTLLLCAADHHITQEGVSHSPQEITWQQVENFAHLRGAVGMMVKDQQVDLQLVDCGVNHDFDKTFPIIDKKVSYGSLNFLKEGALKPHLALKAMDNGRSLVQQQCEKGYEIFMFGEMGVGNTTSASAITASLLSLSPRLCTSKGAGLTKGQLEHKIKIIEQALTFHTEVKSPFDALCAFGGYEIATIVGAILACAESKRVIIIDGFVTASALLIAASINPKVLPYVIASHVGKESGHSLILNTLALRPLLSLDLSLGEGTGALFSWPLIKQALHLYDEMETFEESHVTNSVIKLESECKDEQ
jgi:nicotinate-nucleotide--dimethylbenzimidazole phosphoribosyltransferase